MSFLGTRIDYSNQELNKHMKIIAASLKEAFDIMPAHGTKYPNTKSPIASAARHLRPAAKNLLAAAKAVNETPGIGFTNLVKQSHLTYANRR